MIGVLIVKNVVAPAIISVRSFIDLGSNPRAFSKKVIIVLRFKYSLVYIDVLFIQSA